MNVATLIESSARLFPDRTALICGPARLSYAELDRMASRLAHGLVGLGVKPGDKVALTCPSRGEFAISYFAILKTGAVAVPLNPLLKRDEIAQQLRDSEAVVYLCHEGTPDSPLGRHGFDAFQATPGCREFRAIPDDPQGLSVLSECQSWRDLHHGQPDVFESVDLPNDASCSITFTSGTTGVPKGAEHSHAGEYLSAVLVRHEHGIRHDDVGLSAVPLFGAFRCSILLTTFLTGSTIVIMPRFSPEDVWRAMARERVTVFHGVGPMLHRLYETVESSGIALDAIAGHWRLCISGGAALSPAVHRFFEERLGVDIRIGYGATEIILATVDRYTANDTPGAIGRPVGGVQIRLVDDKMNDVPPGEVGEIIVRSPTCMKRYYNDDEATRQALAGGWFHTGDLARQDAGGGLCLVGRSKDMINRGGYKVYSAQIENVLMTHPAVANCAVIGIPDERYGEEVKACVVLKEGAQCTADELVAWTRDRVAAFAYPRQVEFMDSLPIGATGKVLKRLLKFRK
ncbi:MAG TPA: AMP-binding protein [Candidatus Hydrogenedentes bacterium]|nr:AMP-binding protein [Candidatus Hydrogenedentota bacterium]